MAKHTMQLKFDGIINILADNLYTEPDIFIRELIQNGHDALVKRRKLEPDFTASHARIDISFNEDAQTISVTDNGAGLTKEEIHQYLSTIGSSDKFQNSTLTDESLTTDSLRGQIGQFGIGLLSAFIVASKVEVSTRHMDGSSFFWENNGDGHYTLNKNKRKETGTTITLFMQEESSRYLDATYLGHLIKRYADIIGIPIYLQENHLPINSIDAPWHNNNVTDLTCQHFWDLHTDDLQAVEFIKINDIFEYSDNKTGEQIKSQVKGMLAITAEQTLGFSSVVEVELYVQRMLINKALPGILPSWASFVTGILECDLLRPNAARDNIMVDQHLKELQHYLAKRIMDHIKDLASTNPEKMALIMRWHAFQIIAICNKEKQSDFLPLIAEFVPLYTNVGNINLGSYLKQTGCDEQGRKKILYSFGNEEKTIYSNLVKNSGKIVIDASSNMVIHFLEKYEALYPDKVVLCGLDTLEDDIFKKTTHKEKMAFSALLEAAEQIWPSNQTINLCHFNPAELPLIIVDPPIDRVDMELHDLKENPATPDYLRDLLQHSVTNDSRSLTLHINADNLLMQKVANMAKTNGSNDETVRFTMMAAYNNALMLHLPKLPQNMIETIFAHSNHLIAVILQLGSNAINNQENQKLDTILASHQPEGQLFN